MRTSLARLVSPIVMGLALASCSTATPAVPRSSGHGTPATAGRHTPAAHHVSPPAISLPAPGVRLPGPDPLVSFMRPAGAGQGRWIPAGRLVGGLPAVYETTLVPPGGTQPAGIAWMDTGLLSARLYSGSVSPGGGPYRYTAPIAATQAGTLVAAFNGGFKMHDAHGGYYTEGRLIYPLRTAAASLVVYANGSADIGAWGSDVTMTPQVVSVRQNLTLVVADGRPTPHVATADWDAWGSTCGATSCAHGVPGIEHQWRSGLGITSDGALVYAAGPALDPLQLAQLLVRAGAMRGMQLDINPYWPVFATYDPPTGALAAPSNGHKLLSSTQQGPATFFEASWARDFVTMSARTLR